MKIAKIFAFLFLCTTVFVQAQREYYELRTYEITFGKDANILHNYLQNALMPAMQRQGIENIGAFKEWNVMPEKIYVLIPYESMEQMNTVKSSLAADPIYNEAAQPYLKAKVEDFPVSSYKSSFFISFTGMPKIVKPDASDKFFELRRYLGYNEDALRRKVKMFNDSEFPIFEDAGLKPVFIGEKIFGDNMPCLTYFLAFETFEERAAGWAKFVEHPEWKRIVALEEYANTISRIDTEYLERLPYSKL